MEDWSIIVREQAAFTLWTLAGDQKSQRKMIAEKIGIPQILSMVMSKSEKLQYVGVKCMESLVLENLNFQGLILNENGIEQLIRLLKNEKTSSRVVLATVQAIAALCIDIAHVNNELTQNELVDRDAVQLLLDLLDRQADNKHILIATAHALGCLVLNRENDELVEQRLNLKSIVDLVHTDDLVYRLLCS